MTFYTARGNFIKFLPHEQLCFNRIKSATKFLCVKTSTSKVVLQPFAPI